MSDSINMFHRTKECHCFQCRAKKQEAHNPAFSAVTKYGSITFDVYVDKATSPDFTGYIFNTGRRPGKSFLNELLSNETSCQCEKCKKVRKFVNEIRCEFIRAEQIHPEWVEDAVHAVSILTDETVEAMKEAIDFHFSVPTQEQLERLKIELIQSGAIVFRYLMHLDDYQPKATDDE